MAVFPRRGILGSADAPHAPAVQCFAAAGQVAGPRGMAESPGRSRAFGRFLRRAAQLSRVIFDLRSNALILKEKSDV